jgi:WD40 repeat protein
MHYRLPIALACCLFALSGCRFTTWSPDSKQLALDGEGKLSLFNVRSGKRTPIPTPQREVVSPQWSPGPDNKTTRASLWIYNLASEREKQIADRPLPGIAEIEGFKPKAQTQEALGRMQLKMGGGPAWSPDGKSVACAWPKADNGCQVEVFRLQSDTGEVLTGASNLNNPSWSPDGRYLACLEWDKPSDSGTPAGVRLFDASSNRSSIIWRAPEGLAVMPGMGPQWGADGRVLVYALAGEILEVHAVPSSGGASQLVASLPGSSGDISPNLKLACYVTPVEETGNFKLFAAAAPFNNPKQLDELSQTTSLGTQKKAKKKAGGKGGGGKGGGGKGSKADSDDGKPVTPFPAISPDMKSAAVWVSGNGNGELRIYDLATGQKQVHQLSGK